MEETNTTIGYYGRNAEQYFNSTVNVNMSEYCDRFIEYIVPGGRIINIGAGSGRDIKYFKDRDFVVEGIDASLLHLSIDEIYKIISVAISILAINGVIFISFKKDISTGYDTEGRYFTSFSIENFRNMIKNKPITIRECWNTCDKLNRKGTVWCNIVAQREV